MSSCLLERLDQLLFVLGSLSIEAHNMQQSRLGLGLGGGRGARPEKALTGAVNANIQNSWRPFSQLGFSQAFFASWHWCVCIQQLHVTSRCPTLCPLAGQACARACLRAKIQLVVDLCMYNTTHRRISGRKISRLVLR